MPHGEEIIPVPVIIKLVNAETPRHKGVLAVHLDIPGKENRMSPEGIRIPVQEKLKPEKHKKCTGMNNQNKDDKITAFGLFHAKHLLKVNYMSRLYSIKCLVQ